MRLVAASRFPPGLWRHSKSSVSFRRDPHWKRVSVPALTLSVGILAVFALAVASILVLGFAGYAQRLLIALLCIWTVLVGLHFARYSTEHARGRLQPAG